MSLGDKARKLNRKTLKRLYILWTICGPVALVLTLIANERISALPDPNPVDVPKESALEAKASRFGHDYLILWLAGNKDLQPRIDEVSNTPGGVTLPNTPFSVTDVKDLGPESYERESNGDRNWIFDYDVVGTAPGEKTPTKRRYSVQFVQHGVSYRVNRTPIPINPTATPFRLESGYPETIDATSALGTAIKDFAAAYLTKGDNASLGRTVSGGFKGAQAPVQASPYESIQVTAVFGSQVPPANPDPGTTVHVLANIKAKVDDSDSFSTITLPIEMFYTDQHQWVANALETNARYGASTEAPTDANKNSKPGR